MLGVEQEKAAPHLRGAMARRGLRQVCAGIGAEPAVQSGRKAPLK